MRDEGGPFEAGDQVLISSHRKLLSSKAMVVNVAEKSEGEMPRNGESTESNLRKARLTRSAGSSQCGPTLISPQSRDVNLCAIIGTSVQP